MGWDGMGWDGMGWDGMGWDGMGWDGMGWGGHCRLASNELDVNCKSSLIPTVCQCVSIRHFKIGVYDYRPLFSKQLFACGRYRHRVDTYRGVTQRKNRKVFLTAHVWPPCS